MNELQHSWNARRSEGMTQGWVEVCGVDDIIPNTGVCALVNARQIAVVRVGEGEEIYAISNFDPFSKAFVISRGIVGDKGGVPKIASPIYKQNFDLRTGQCLDDPSVRIPVYPVRVRGGRVEVQATALPLPAAS
ncbi:nitrite reductase small subunit NirD [Sorangium sp. So ce1335]|uniref:nitrite reductase small subunit NirD n=1 Tax=Sorangium sp. So ce1335 TaxID=3133335 RepID=UPI003F62D6A6